MQIRYFVSALCFLVTIVAPVEAQQRQKVIVTTPGISFNQFPVYKRSGRLVLSAALTVFALLSTN